MAYNIALPFLNNKHGATRVKNSVAALSSDGAVSAFMFKRLSGIAFKINIATSQNTLFTESLNVLTAVNTEIQFSSSGGSGESYVHPTGDGNLHVPVTSTHNNGHALIAGGTAGSMAWTALTNSMVGLGNVDNTSDADKPVSTATQTALDLKADTTHPHVVATTSVDGFLSATDKTKLDGIATGANNYVHPTGDGNLHVPATGTTSDGFALIAGATEGSGAWTALTKSMVGLSAVDNTADADKPVSTATQTALDLKADTTHTHVVATTSVDGFMSAADKTKLDGISGSGSYVHPTGDGNLHVPATGTTSDGFALIAGATEGSGAWTALTKAMVGLANVDNTADADKPVSTATQTALDLKADTTHPHVVATTSVDGFLSATDKTKLDGIATGANNYVHPTGDGNLHVPATGTTSDGFALIAGATEGSGAWTALTKSMVGLSAVDNTADADKPVSTATQTALDLKADTTHTHVVATTSVDGFMSAADKTKLDGISGSGSYVHPTGDGNLHVPATGTTSDGFALIAGATEGSGAWTALTKAMVGLANVDNTADADKPVSAATVAALALKANSSHTHASATTSVAGFMSTTDKSNSNSLFAGYVGTFTSSAALRASFPTGGFAGYWARVYPVDGSTVSPFWFWKDDVHLWVPVLTRDNIQPTQIAGELYIGDTHGAVNTVPAATTAANGAMSAADKTKLDSIAFAANNYVHPTGDGSTHVPATGTGSNGFALIAGATEGSGAWTALTKAMVGLANVDNTADADKPVSTAAQTALDLKADTTHTHEKAAVGLANVDNTADANKPVSAATQLALNLKSDTTHLHAVATTSVAGFMSAADKTKLDGISASDVPADLRKSVITASGTYTLHANAKYVQFIVYGGGGGGGSGRKGATATARAGGGGGSGSIRIDRTMSVGEITSPITITIGAGGTGGAGVTANSTNGNIGGTGGTTYVNDASGKIVTAYGGRGGGAGAAVAPAGGISYGDSILGGNGGAGGATTGGTSYPSATGPTGGGGGGGVSSSNVAYAGGAVTASTELLVHTSLAGGAVGKAGTSGVSNTDPLNGGGGGGGGAGGGASMTATAAGAGGAGGLYGAGGGGGGAALDTTTPTSGAGGAGAPGSVIIIQW